MVVPRLQYLYLYTGLASPIGDMEGNLLYVGLDSNWNYFNIGRDLAALNAKNEEVVDRDGHVAGYMCNIRVAAGPATPASINFITAPNTWKMRNAVRKTHFLRQAMFEDAGVTESEMGKYGKTLRPHLTTAQVSDTVYKDPYYLRPVNDSPSAGGTLSTLTGGEWSYTTLASSPSWDNTPLINHDSLPMADTYTIAICGPNREQDDAGGIKSWSTIGLINSYNLDRMEQIPDATADSSISGTNNPFAMLQSQSVVSGEVAEIAEDQQLETPPYDITDDGDSVELLYNTRVIANVTESVRNVSLFVPAGLFAVTCTAALSGAIMTVDVVGKVLCKDIA
ncbi:MAG: hypothetical protein [Circular genetic element sp.]|nr:MAG: hypothetical protein [Circular genetic element sp.]